MTEPMSDAKLATLVAYPTGAGSMFAAARLAAELTTIRAALRFILAFYEPGQTHLDTEAWKLAEAGARACLPLPPQEPPDAD